MRAKSSRSAESAPSPPPWASDLGSTIRARRKQLRLTQKQLATLSSCGPDFLYDLERGKPTVQLGKLVTVLEALGLKLDVQLEPRSGGLGTLAVSGDWISAMPKK